ncbi:DUF2007 domain-containing protein [Marinilabiliaceae bacterium ANBcel2]|nr:DUF2007 domain-containing protein [Marinilabiliaceae bacterium ANBcel2]
MKDNTETIRVYTGSEVSVAILKGKLEEVGVSSMIKSDFNSSIAAGFVQGTRNAVDLYVQKKDLSAAESVIKKFLEEDH